MKEALVLAACAIAMSALGQSAPSAARNSAPLTLRAAEPLDPLFKEGSTVYVPCLFDGQSEDCFLDTGSNSTRIENDPFSQGYSPADRNSQTGISSSTLKGEDVSIAKFQIGPLVLRSFRAFRPAVDSPCARDKNHSAVGVNAFKDRILEFSFGNKNQLLIGGQSSGGKDERPLSVSPAGQFSVPVEIGSKTVGAMWDTGAALTVVSSEYVASHPDEFIFVKDWRYSDQCGSGQGKFYRIKSMAVGGRAFHQVLVSVFPPFSAGLKKFFKSFPGPDVQMSLGMNVIERETWTFDLKNKTWSSH